MTSSGEMIPMTDPRVTVLLPSMGRISSEAVAAVFRSAGMNALAHPPADEAILKLGRANTSCKECLPLILTTGTLLNYLGNGRRKDEVVVYFMTTASGPCRFGQYYIFLEELVKKLKLSDVAMFSLSSENAYAGMGNGFHQRGWWGIITADVMEDIRSMLLANARDPEDAMRQFDVQWKKILDELESGEFARLEKQLIQTAEQFRNIPLKRPSAEVPVISLVGEIFVRRDQLSRQYLTEHLARKGFATVCAPVSEWMLYSEYLVDKNLAAYKLSMLERLKSMLKRRYMTRYEARIKSLLSRSGLVHAAPLDVETIIRNATPYISQNLTCEAILTVGTSLTEVVSHSCGVIAIGPFGCMPNRLAEALLNDVMNRKGKLATDPENPKLHMILKDMEDLPFLAIESDGSLFPQLIHAKLETFCLRAERLHEKMLNVEGISIHPN